MQVQMSWTFVNDSLCTTLCLQWEPEVQPDSNICSKSENMRSTKNHQFWYWSIKKQITPGDCNCADVPGCQVEQIWGEGLERENGAAQALVSVRIASAYSHLIVGGIFM